MTYELKTFFFLEEGNEQHRYIQIGMESEAGDFTGVIIDYVGGGAYGNFYFVNGECLNSSEDLEGADDDEFENELENFYPGINDQLYDVFGRYALWNGEAECYEFTEEFVKEFGPFQKEGDVMIGKDGLTPIAVGNTYFEGWKTIGPDEPIDPTATDFDCDKHGKQKVAFVCQHLKEGEDLGFIEGNPDPEADYQFKEAWCIKCDTVLAEQGGEWNDIAQEHAYMEAVCVLCYEQIKKRNL